MKPSSLALMILLVPVSNLGAQESYTTIEWWHPLAATAGVAALLLIDEPVRDFIQDNRSGTLDDIGDVMKRMKDAEVFYVTSGAAIAVGLAAGRPEITRTGAQIMISYGLSAGFMYLTKWALGRTRPSATPDDAFEWDTFDGGAGASFPSGTASNVFSLATTLADAIDRPVASVVLYSAASVTSWSRLNSDRHWLSDVTMGALYGITAAKIVNGRWRIFGLRPPSLLIGPRGEAGVQYSIEF